MRAIELCESVYRDKVMGCWLGKNAGGTLGTPLEKAYGYREPFNISFYTRIQESGSPNDDLELQIIWLMALEERGLGITCRDLAEYWLNHVGYNFDEYGYLKRNLRCGLCPPVAGWFNNPFRDCMGSPIRSEIWACIAPGLPDVAAHYAWHDAVCDHAGGESVYGEMFNAALESAAFVVSDRDTLLDIGLSTIPEDCKTAQTIRKARDAHRQGMNWLDARNAVLDFAYHFNAQYSPVNLGFLTVGWLYGQDFGDALCKAVNCGYDTDCTAATLGAILGIINGARALPEKWIKPLGKTIATTPPPGIMHLDKPNTTDELTDRVIAIGRQLMAKHYDRIRLVEGTTPTSDFDPNALVDTHAIQDILGRSYDTVIHALSSVEVLVQFPEMPGISMSKPLNVQISLKNRGPQPLVGVLRLQLPDGFSCDTPDAQPFIIEGRSQASLGVKTFKAEDSSKLLNVNRAWIFLDIEKHPSTEAVPIPMIGAKRWLVSKPFPGQTIDGPEAIMRTMGCAELNSVADWCGNELNVEPFFNQTPGVIYLQHYLWNPQSRPVRLCVANSYQMKLWVNGIQRNRTKKIVPCRPALWGDTDPDLEWHTDENGNRVIDHINSMDMELPYGWNHILIKLERGHDPIEAFFTVASIPDYHGLDDMEQTRFPWDVPDPEYARQSYSTDLVFT
jgi:ADP-ribosylglycohydrolase